MTKRQLRHSLRSTLHSAEYIIDVPNIAFGPKISCECIGWCPAGNVDRYTSQQWLFVHIMWRVWEQSRWRILDSDITLCSCDVDSRQDEEHHAELPSRLRIVCGQEDDAVREHRACKVSSTAYLLSLNSVLVVSEIILS